MNMKINSSDNNFPHTLKSMVYGGLWNSMFSEYLREFDFQAQEAGIRSVLDFDRAHLMYGYCSYNTKVEKYLEKVF